MSQHPELVEEQAYIDHAYECLERAREQAIRLRGLTEVGRGGTHQARYERDVFDETVVNRLAQLDLGDAALVFGRIDRDEPGRGASTSAASPSPTSARSRSSSTGGRRSPSRSTGPPAASRWASPAAATSPSRAARCSASRTSCSATATSASARRRSTARRRPGGLRTLLAALERGRTGQLGDIVATIQAEQDEIIRSPAARRARRAGRPRHRQDRRRAAPRRLPALHAPLPARGPGRARRRPEPGVPALHRAGAAVARRGRRRAGRARRPRARRRRSQATDGDRGRSGQGRRAHGDVLDEGRPRPGAAAPRRPRRAVRRSPGSGSTSRRRGASCAVRSRRAHAHNAGRRFVEQVRVRRARGQQPRPDRRRRRSASARGRPTRCAPRSSACGRCSRRRSCLHDLFGSRGAAATRVASAPSTRTRPSCSCDPGLSDVDDVVLDRRRRRPARRGARAARPASARGNGSTRPTRSAPTATSSSTRRRTSRRCSCGC